MRLYNKKQIDLLMYLRQDGRKKLTEISRDISMPISTIFDKLKANQNDVIKRFTCLLDFRKIGFGCRAHIVFRIRKDDRDGMRDFFLKHQNVNSVYKINNGYDFLIETIFKEIKEVDEFLDRVEDKFRVHEKRVYYIIDDIARERFMTDPVHVKMVIRD